MCWIRAQLEPHVQRLQHDPEPMAALVYQAFDAVKTKLLAIVNNDFGSGCLALVGGIQINMPSPYEDYFLPLMFRVSRAGQPDEILTREFRVEPTKSSSGGAQQRVFHWLSWSPSLKSPCYNSLQRHFPKALPGLAIHARVRAALQGEGLGLTPANTLCCTSICPDEINSEKGGLADAMKRYWGKCFPLGGISGVPFVGKTGFGTLSHDVPDNGHVFLLFGPHVSIS